MGIFTKKTVTPSFLELPCDDEYGYRISGVMDHQDALKQILGTLKRKDYADGWLITYAIITPQPDESLQVSVHDLPVGCIPSADAHVFARAIKDNNVDLLAVKVMLKWRPDLPDTKVGVMLGWDPYVSYN